MRLFMRCGGRVPTQAVLEHRSKEEQERQRERAALSRRLAAKDQEAEGHKRKRLTAKQEIVALAQRLEDERQMTARVLRSLQVS